jgi:phenylalanyl-tRNA synthetase beta chain
MKLSRDWLNDYVDLSDLSNDDLERRFTEIGHAIEAVEPHGDDVVFDLEITTNRVDAMSHVGMARELAAALGRETRRPGFSPALQADAGLKSGLRDVPIRIDASDMCRRFTAAVIRGVAVKPSSPQVQRRLASVGLRPINNLVDVTNYVMMALGHPMHAYDLDRLAGPEIIVRAGKPGESFTTLDGEKRVVDPSTVIIADAKGAIGLGGVMGGAESEIRDSTKNVLLECAWFEPAFIRRTARRLGLKTDASYRFERRVDPNDTVNVIETATKMLLELAGCTFEGMLDVNVAPVTPKTIRLRSAKLHATSGGVVGDGYALDLFRRLGFGAETAHDGLLITVPTYRGDIHEEMDLIEEVLRFFGFNNIPSEMPRVTTGDVREEPVEVLESTIRDIAVGCGLSEAVNYSFIHPDYNPLFTSERPIAITNALTETIASMRLSLLPGLLETVAFNRSYGTRDGALFEVGRTYHRNENGAPASAGGSVASEAGVPSVIEKNRVGVVMFGSVISDSGEFWGDTKRLVDFFDIKGVVEQIAAKVHLPLSFQASDQAWLKKGKRATAFTGDVPVATIGFISTEVLQRFGIKGDVAAAEIDVEVLLGATGKWTMADVSRFPGVPMILALTHSRDLPYQRLIDAVRSFNVDYLHEVGLRDRFIPEGEETIKTTLGMWYQAFDRSLTQDEVAAAHQQLAARLAATLPVKVIS